jgi:putative ABC transport system permease protein
MAAVGSFGLLTVTSIGVFERQREIGVMRSVGASSRTILTQFLLEGLLTGIIAWLAGLPLSYVLSVILIDSVPFSDVIAFEYTLLAPIIGLAGMLLAIGLATLYPSVTATRKTVSQILHYQ